MRPVPGSVYEVVRQFTVQSGKTYEPGMHLELYEETTEKPFGFESRISNWIVKCPFFAPPAPEAIWSSIWLLIEQGYLKYVGNVGSAWRL